jgi:hypothetical protein
MSFFKNALKAIKKVANNKVFQVAAGGLAVVFPPAGIPLAAGVAITKKVTDGISSADPKIRQQAVAVVKNTAALAKQGDVGAKRAVALMKLTHAATKGTPQLQAAAKAKLGRLALADKTRQAKAKQIAGQFGITRQGRIMHKKTKRYAAPSYR